MSTYNSNLKCCYLPKMKESSVFDVITIDSVLEAIKNEEYKPLIDALPDCIADKKAYTLAKKRLPAWSLNGEFSKNVKNDNFVKSNGLCHFDIDKLDKVQVATIKKAIAKQCPYVYALWISPSQSGLKGLIRIPNDLIHSDTDFKQAFIQIERALAALGLVIDTSCKDVRRLCFVCADKDIYINEAAQPFEFDMTLWVATSTIQVSEVITISNDTVVAPYVYEGNLLYAEHESICIERLTRLMQSATPGTRHFTRLRAGRLAGGYIAGNKIAMQKVVDILLQLSDSVADDGVTSQSEIKTIMDAIKNGQLTPIFDLDKEDEFEHLDWELRLKEHVAKFNKTHASVVIGGNHRVLRCIDAAATLDGRISYEFFSLNQLSLVHDNTRIKIGEKEVQGKLKDIFANHLMAWAKNFDCRTFTGGVVFLPNRKAPPKYFNTWSGFSIKPIQNDELLVPIYLHIKSIICDGNPELNKYFINWVAYTIQHPDKPAGAALVLRGDKGSGKGIIGHFLRGIWGNHGLHISNTKHLVGNFNAHLSDVCFLFADEAFYSGDKLHEGVLKALITEPTVMIERKGLDAVSQPNYLKVFMATNSDYAVPASKDERRYCVFDVSNALVGDMVYFNALHGACSDKATQSAFLYAMLTHDLTGWHTGNIPDSIGLREQRYHSMGSVQKWLVDSLMNGGFSYGLDIFNRPVFSNTWTEIIEADDLWVAYLRWCDQSKVSEYRRVTQASLGKYLSLIYWKSRNSRGIYYMVGSLEDAKKNFEEYERIFIDDLVGEDIF